MVTGVRTLYRVLIWAVAMILIVAVVILPGDVMRRTRVLMEPMMPV
jgi:hypothetical protein